MENVADYDGENAQDNEIDDDTYLNESLAGESLGESANNVTPLNNDNLEQDYDNGEDGNYDVSTSSIEDGKISQEKVTSTTKDITTQEGDIISTTDNQIYDDDIDIENDLITSIESATDKNTIKIYLSRLL